MFFPLSVGWPDGRSSFPSSDHDRCLGVAGDCNLFFIMSYALSNTKVPLVGIGRNWTKLMVFTGSKNSPIYGKIEETN